MRAEGEGATEDEMAVWHMSLGKLRELLMDRKAWRAAVWHDLVTELD